MSRSRAWERYGGMAPAIWTLIAAAGAFLLSTAVLVLWFPIAMDAITRADDAGWDESLLLPNQFPLTFALLGCWFCGLGAVIASAVIVHAAAAGRTLGPRTTILRSNGERGC